MLYSDYFVNMKKVLLLGTRRYVVCGCAAKMGHFPFNSIVMILKICVSIIVGSVFRVSFSLSLSLSIYLKIFNFKWNSTLVMKREELKELMKEFDIIFNVLEREEAPNGIVI